MLQKIFVIIATSFIAHTACSMDINYLLNPAPVISPQETASLPQATIISDKKKFTCDSCTKKFSSQSNLCTHKKNIHEKHRFYCNVKDCKKYFNTTLSAKRHRKDLHNITGHICYYPECIYQGNSSSELQSHTQTIHIYHPYKDKFFWCNIDTCDAKFSTRDSIKKHRSKEHNIHDYICFYEGCKKSFGIRGKLQNHTRYKHPKSLEFTCSDETCKQTFLTDDELINHITSDHIIEAQIVSPQECIQESA